MDKVRLALSLVTIAIIVVPIVGVLIAYQNNLLGLFIPPEVNDIASNLMTGGGTNLEPPTVVGEPKYDPTSRTVSLTFQFTNPFNLSITINSMSGSVECAEHNFHLGNATLSNPVSVGAGEKATITVLVTWTEEAISHFQTAHAGEKEVDVNLVGLTVDVKGIKIQTNQSIKIPNPTL